VTPRLLLSPLLVGLILTTSAAGADWKPYKAPEDLFEVQFPNDPIVRSQKVSDGKTIVVYAAADLESGVFYVVTVFELEPEFANRTEERMVVGLDSLVLGLLEGSKGKMTAKRPITFKGARVARQFEGNVFDGAIEVRGRSYYINGKAYVVLVRTPKEKDAKADATRFLDSFKVK
jgi:hypothetical protein